MNTLTERMNLSNKVVENAHVMKKVHLGIAAYDTLCLICHELNINVDEVSEADFYSASEHLKNFCQSLDEGQTTVSVWFDNE